MKIVFPRLKRPLKVKDVNKTQAEILDIINKEVKDAKKHFKDQENGGWRLDKSYILSDILFRIFGCHIADELDQAFINAGLIVEYENNTSYVAEKGGYKPIYMHRKTGKLIVVENADDTSFLFKYNVKNGYDYIGRL